MTDEHYKRIKIRIKREIAGTLATSFWITLALSAVLLAVSLIITVHSATLNEGTQGEMELGYWVCFGFAAFCVVMHLKFEKTGSERAADVINELDTHLIKIPHAEPVAPPVPQPKPAWPARTLPFESPPGADRRPPK
jgi:ABC-type branched-subunit amino acid transport system permease subunit